MKEIFQKNGEKLVLGTILNSIISLVVVYILIGPLNDTITELLPKIKEGGFEVSTCLILFPIFLIVFFTMNLSEAVLKNGKNK